MPQESPAPLRKSLFTPDAFSDVIHREGGYDEIALGPALFARLGSKSIEWQQQPVENSMKVAFDGFSFRKSFSLSPSDLESMGDFHPAHYYVSSKFIEVECHGPTKVLPPASETSLAETWELHRD